MKKLIVIGILSILLASTLWCDITKEDLEKKVNELDAQKEIFIKQANEQLVRIDAMKATYLSLIAECETDSLKLEGEVGIGEIDKEWLEQKSKEAVSETKAE